MVRALEWDKPGLTFNFVTYCCVSLDNLLNFSQPQPSNLPFGDENIYFSAQGELRGYILLHMHIVNAYYMAAIIKYGFSFTMKEKSQTTSNSLHALLLMTASCPLNTVHISHWIHLFIKYSMIVLILILPKYVYSTVCQAQRKVKLNKTWSLPCREALSPEDSVSKGWDTRNPVDGMKGDLRWLTDIT